MMQQFCPASALAAAHSCPFSCFTTWSRSSKGSIEQRQGFAVWKDFSAEPLLVNTGFQSVEQEHYLAPRMQLVE